MSQAVPLTHDLLPTLRDFIFDQWRIDGARSEMHIGDVYVTLYFVAESDLEDSAALWYDRAGELQGVAFPGLTFDMVIRPESCASPLAEDMIAWAISEAKRRNPDIRRIHVQRRPRLRERVLFLEDLGFRRSATGAVALERTLCEMLRAANLPPGFTFRALHIGDVPSRVRAFVDAFPGEPKLIADYERLMRCDGYEHSLDLVAVDESDEVAAFCSAWFDRVNRVGLFEPVGTCSRYRRMGLAQALLLEGLQRLKQLGATSAVIRARNNNAAAIACYRKCGFSIVSDTFGFERDIDI